MSQQVVIIDYGAGNIQSVQFALERLGVKAQLTSDATQIASADKVIFPGVGHATPALKALQEKGLDTLIPTLSQPVLGICLGMQLMCNFLEENNTNGLGIFSVDVRKFSATPKVPHIGWNKIDNVKSSLFKDVTREAYLYFVHSYFADISESTIAVTNYGIPFSAALQKVNFYGCQFHPEKSGAIGEQILSNFLTINQ
ncbi:MAG: imidazole glycerol phosphate synthase subunit HisH [Cyclobacteriaceae bacterium]|nr:imidazole glycerol phosphate synthase subunit HisH [Cyclobacteriaceae bacterium]